MAEKMSAQEFRKLSREAGWTRPEEIAVALGISAKSVYNYSKRGCPLLGNSKRMRRQFEEAIQGRRATA